MDDFNMASLTESKNEWCLRLLNILSPTITQGLRSIYEEAVSLCKSNNENDKYLMTFQNFLTRVPKWNSSIIDDEKNRIIEQSACTYLEDLITCVHIIQLKALTCIRVGTKQKKIDINIPSLPDFIHKIYIHVARSVYTNIYLFEKNIAPLQTQKNNRELELIIKECILNSIRDSIPIEHILRSYMDETEEQNVEISETQEELPPLPESKTNEEIVESNSVDDSKNKEEEISANLQSVIEEFKETGDSNELITNNINDKDTVTTSIEDNIMEEDEEDEEEDERLMIGDSINLDELDVNDLNKTNKFSLDDAPVLDFEVLN